MSTDSRTLFPTRAHLISAIADRDGYFCYLCRGTSHERGFSSTDRPTVEHVLPLAKGGTWALENLKLAHQRCNSEKGDRLLLEDGTLEPRKKGSPEPYVDKDKILANHCEECASGRLLLPDEFCNVCGRGAIGFPWSTKLAPKDCPHSGVWWCWLDAAGIVDRAPAIVSVLDGEYMNETDDSSKD